MADLNEIRRVYEIVDKNADGEVYQPILNNKDDIEKDESKDLMEAFGVFDENKDGYITSEELQHVLSTIGLIPWSQDLQQCEQMIWRFDLDRNGVLDFAEFKSMMSSEPSP
ncbi:hypothetical protein SUGI_0210050 [Cryptomeria japonica]|uniref:calmodulin-like protein 3 n=1 Tax=Cryptomeria japonica TaxID=3369 RepID=UPI002408D526|nr:calmodulin-like protein 3 [Cryptomeria japonica]GLJ13306.1 hypothetical protein SUGI_0210050 [Cryptomeria japonica]